MSRRLDGVHKVDPRTSFGWKNERDQSHEIMHNEDGAAMKGLNRDDAGLKS